MYEWEFDRALGSMRMIQEQYDATRLLGNQVEAARTFQEAWLGLEKAKSDVARAWWEPANTARLSQGAAEAVLRDQVEAARMHEAEGRVLWDRANAALRDMRLLQDRAEAHVRGLQDQLDKVAATVEAAKEQFQKVAVGFPAQEYLEQINKLFEQQALRASYAELEITRQALEGAISPFPLSNLESIGLYRPEPERRRIREGSQRINAAIVAADFVGEVAVDEDKEAREGQASSVLEHRIVEVVPEGVLEQLRGVEFIPFHVLDRIARSPNAMSSLTPRAFEEFVARLIEELGFEDVVITPKSGDQGRDVLATRTVKGIPVLFAFECKRYSPKRLVGPEILRALLGTITHGPTKANKGVLVTTSKFTSGARRFLLTEPALDGKDFDGIVEWLKDYAKLKTRH